jgi:hypothetical protein
VIADGHDLMTRLPRPAQYCTILAYQPVADGTPVCYRGPLYAEWDAHDPVAVLAELRMCLQVLQVEFDLAAEALWVWHSGGQGYHLTLPAVAIGAADGHTQLPRIYRAMVERLWPASIAPSLDCSIYSMGKGRMWRLPSRRRSDTGWYKVPLAAREVLHRLAADLEALTGHPRRGLFWLPEEELRPCAGLVRLYEEARADLERQGTVTLSLHAPSSKPGILYELFAARGWLGRELSAGRWAVICPWTDAHTTGMPGDSSTVLFGPGEGEELGWWHCSHAHCAGRGLRATLYPRNGTLQTPGQLKLAHPKTWVAFVQEVADRSGCPTDAIIAAIHELTEAIEILLRPRRPTPAHLSQEHGRATPPARPHVQVNERFLRHIVTDAVDTLAAANESPTLFMRGSALVRVAPNDVHAVPLSVPMLRVFLDHAADFVRVFQTKEGEEVRVPDRPPHDVCESILAVPPRDAFPRLASIRSVPVILPDGRVLATDGYDRASGLLLRLSGLDGMRTDMPLPEAKAWLFHELLGDFPFADEASRAHTVALLLEPFLRPMIKGPTPLYLIDAPIRGSSKGLLADVACLITSGRKADVMTLVQGNAEEHEKRITALLLAGAP